MSDSYRAVAFKAPTVTVEHGLLRIRKNPRINHDCDVGCDITELVIPLSRIESCALARRSHYTDAHDSGHLTVVGGTWAARINMNDPVGLDWADDAAVERMRHLGDEMAVLWHQQIMTAMVDWEARR